VGNPPVETIPFIHTGTWMAFDCEYLFDLLVLELLQRVLV
jgi:hypothetical protein